jgi:hypothetical protein
VRTHSAHSEHQHRRILHLGELFLTEVFDYSGELFLLDVLIAAGLEVYGVGQFILGFCNCRLESKEGCGYSCTGK